MLEKQATNKSVGMRRLKGPSEGRSAGTIYGELAWTAAVPNNREQHLQTQATDLFAKIESQLEDMGSDKGSIISATVWLADMAQKPLLDSAWIEWIGPDKKAWPQRVCVGATLAGGCLVEMAVVGLRTR